MRKVISLILVVAMLSAFVVPVFATPPENEELPSWVGDGEIWVPANGVMPAEDFGECPRGHAGPAGFQYQGYTIGQVTGNYDDIALILTFISIFSGNEIVIRVASAGAALLSWLDGQEDPNLKYFKYVYTAEGRAPYIHIIYTYYEGGMYNYITCETYYDI